MADAILMPGSSSVTVYETSNVSPINSPFPRLYSDPLYLYIRCPFRGNHCKPIHGSIHDYALCLMYGIVNLFCAELGIFLFYSSGFILQEAHPNKIMETNKKV